VARADPSLALEAKLPQRSVALPRRFSKTLKASTAIDPLFARCIESAAVNVNANKGYALARAVFVGHKQLVDLLTRKGADPRIHKNIALTFAVRKQDLALLRRLLAVVPPVSFSGRFLSEGNGTALMDEAIKAGGRPIIDLLKMLGAFVVIRRPAFLTVPQVLRPVWNHCGC
jgi:hypothetical protein